jgi:hypothetical protein
MTSEELILKAAHDHGWGIKKNTGIKDPYAGWWIRKGQNEVLLIVDAVDGGMMLAETRNREFDGRNEVLDYIKETR